MIDIDNAAVFFHTACNIIGLIGNGLLLYLVIRQTPKTIRTYSILMFNFGLTDFCGCLAAIFVQQRIIPIESSLVYVSSGPCKYLGSTVCYVGYSFMLHCYSHSLWSLLLSFLYRYYVLKSQAPTVRCLILILLSFYSISLFQFVSLATAADDPIQLKAILHAHFPSYALEDEVVSGQIDIFQWRPLFCVVHMTVPVTPVYCIIIIARKRTIDILQGQEMSENTKRTHKQLLQALTIQAVLPGVFLLGVVTYALGQLGIYNHPILEHTTSIALGILPALSPLVTLYFVRPYNNWIRKNLLKKTSIEDARVIYSQSFKKLDVSSHNQR